MVPCIRDLDKKTGELRQTREREVEEKFPSMDSTVLHYPPSILRKNPYPLWEGFVVLISTSS